MNDRERAEAMAAFLAWPGPAAATMPRPGLRAHLVASLAALAIGCALAVCSLAFPLGTLANGAWAVGGHVTLFCHLAL